MFLGLLAQGRSSARDKDRQLEAQRQAQTFSAALGLANIQHLNAETKKLSEPTAADWSVTDPGDGSPLLRVNKSTGETLPLTRTDGSPVLGKAKPYQPTTREEAIGFKKDEAKAGAEAQRDYGYHPPHEEPIVQVQGPDGNPIWTTRDQAIGQKAKVTTKVESATNTAAAARLKAAVSEMNNAHKGMDEFEEGLRSGKYSINGIEQLGGRMASAFTHDDPVSMTLQAAALASLNKTNPALARYIRRGLSFAEGESMISQRPSDFRTKMSAFLSQAASGASPEMISDIQSRRNSILNPLNETVGENSGGGGTLGPTHSPSAGSTGDIDLRTPKKKKSVADEEFDALINKYKK